MANENEIVVRLNTNVMTHQHLYYATLEYYMENNARQKDWKEVPGFVVGNSEDEVVSKGNALAAELDLLDLYALHPAVKKLIASKQLFRKPQDALS
jgi:hypothetical protein